MTTTRRRDRCGRCCERFAWQAAAPGIRDGVLNQPPAVEQWKPFTSRQRVIARRPGFPWDARIAMLPGMAVRVVDGHVAGRSPLRAAVQGQFTVAEQQGDGDIARGELMRWFAEALWVPTALLPSQGVRWEAVDDQCCAGLRVVALTCAVGSEQRSARPGSAKGL